MYRLLVVDDEKMIRMGIKSGIPWDEIGIGEVFTAASAREALEVIKEHHPQIMLTDISMTEMTGLDLIEKIRAKDEEMRIIVLTGYDRFDYARQCLHMRVQNFLLKPIDEEELLEHVREQVQSLEEIRRARENKCRQQRAEGFRQQVLLEEFMRELVHRGRSGEGTGTCPDELGADAYRRMQIAILIPDFDMQESVDENFRLLTIKNICMGMVDARRKGITFVDRDNRLIIAFFTDGGEQSITEQIQELCDILEDESNIKPRIVLGSEVSGLHMLPVSYNDAVYLLLQEREGFQDIIRTSRERDKEQIIQEVYRELKKEMVANLANGEYVMHAFEAFWKATVSYNFSRMQVQKCCFEIASSIYFSYLAETGETMDKGLDSFIKSLVGAGREEALEVTENFIRQLVFRESNEKNEIIALAKRYIDENLEADLSVTSLAEEFYVSPNYFSRLFKRVLGEGCNEYIVRRRIEKSKRLLETTTIKTGKIAMMVGYNDTNYFSLAFKKHNGMSPTKYREMIQNQMGN